MFFSSPHCIHNMRTGQHSIQWNILDAILSAHPKKNNIRTTQQQAKEIGNLAVFIVNRIFSPHKHHEFGQIFVKRM